MQHKKTKKETNLKNIDIENPQHEMKSIEVYQNKLVENDLGKFTKIKQNKCHEITLNKYFEGNINSWTRNDKKLSKLNEWIEDQQLNVSNMNELAGEKIEDLSVSSRNTVLTNTEESMCEPISESTLGLEGHHVNLNDIDYSSTVSTSSVLVVNEQKGTKLDNNTTKNNNFEVKKNPFIFERYKTIKALSLMYRFYICSFVVCDSDS